VINARVILNYWGERARAALKVYAYGSTVSNGNLHLIFSLHYTLAVN